MNKIKKGMGLILFTLTLSCGDTTDSPSTADGVVKASGQKGDEWDWRNDPARFRADLNYKWAELPQEGKSSKIAWADTYWPTYKDSANDRWQGRDVLSPVEKWDKAFNGWDADADFMALKPFDPSTCEWDEAYYEGLGPAAKWVSSEKGNWKARNGVDDDRDGLSDKEECGYGNSEKDLDGVERWWGLCHAWVPAAILEDEPQGPVTRNGVTFEVADIKALMVLQHDKSDAYMLGGRCNEAEVDRDDNGRLTQDQCRDVNAGSFHVIVTNFLGVQSRPIAEDRTYNYEVWNQPVVAYQITEQKELSLTEVNQLLKVGTPDEEGLPITPEEKDGVLLVVNADFDTTEFTEEVGLAPDVIEAILKFKNGADELPNTSDDLLFSTFDELESLFEVGPRSLSRMLVYARQKTWAPAPELAIYSFNKNAKKFVSVKMTLDYITESDASKEPNSEKIQTYTRHDWYEYILEIDENDEIIGGEWVGASIQSHPDFLWLPIRAVSGAPDVDLEIIRDIVRESRQETLTENKFGSDTNEKIPDNNVNGLTSEVLVEKQGVIDSLTLDLKIEHSYKGDLIVRLKKVGTQAVVIYDGQKEDNPWGDDVVLSSKEIAGFGGVELKGKWQVIVHDSGKDDIGSLVSWNVNVKVK